MSFKHKVLMQLRYLRLLKVQAILLKDLEFAMKDLDEEYCDKIDKSPIEICNLIQNYTAGVAERNKEK